MVRFPAEFHFEFFAVSLLDNSAVPSQNEIKHDHSSVVIVILDPRYD